jgi:hypothetical protein
MSRDQFGARDHEVSHARDIAWTLQVKQATEQICEGLIGNIRIVVMSANGARNGKPFEVTHSVCSPCTPRQNPLCGLCVTDVILRSDSGSVTPISV